jgi:TrmH family RNA methyltransferase
MDAGRVRVVLVRTRSPGNVGAAARALKSMGLERLVLVAPRRPGNPGAARMAVHARDVLARARVVSSLAEAVGDCELVVGTTSRPAANGRAAVPPRAVVSEILAAATRQDVALVFGPEDHGLRNDELDVCHRVVTIPTSPAYRSLNLAQAVLVCLYELFVGAETDRVPPAPPERAAVERLEFMFGRLEAGLGAIGFLHPGSRRHMMAVLRRILGAAPVDDRAVSVLLGVARQMQWAGGRAGRSGARGVEDGAGDAARGAPEANGHRR